MNEIKNIKNFLMKKNIFILTELSYKRMTQIIYYIKSGNSFLLKGELQTQ